jgi:hypothetical protein
MILCARHGNMLEPVRYPAVFSSYLFTKTIIYA